MKIAVLQFAPRLGEVAANFSRAESLLMREEREGLLRDIDLLVLPELAFTGYNHASLAAIAPFLEPTAAGPSTRWAARTAKRLQCTVAVGYPEAAEAEAGNYNTVFDRHITAAAGTVAYNSLVVVSHTGDVVAHYRKTFLYYTDETWAQPGPGFWAGVLPVGAQGRQVKAAAGICMDINPYRFQAPWTAYEFATHARDARARVVVVSMAWLTRLTAAELSAHTMTPDHGTLSYWIDRFQPLFSPQGPEAEAIVVCANRTGDEGHSALVGEVCYAGSSCVMGMRQGQQIRLWDMLGRAQEGVLLVDTDEPPSYALVQKVMPDASTAMAPTGPGEMAIADSTTPATARHVTVSVDDDPS